MGGYGKDINMKTILSTIFGWTIVIAGVFLIFVIIQLWEWWRKRRGSTYTPPERQKPAPEKDSGVPQTRISEPQTRYFSDLELHGSRGKGRKSKPRIPYLLTSPPPIPKPVPHPFDYRANWWRELSWWYRDQKGWRCEECQISLRDDPYYLHTHHVWGTRYNEPKDLKALCLACHAEQPGQHHRGLRETEDYKHFIKKYGRRWQM